MNLPAPIEIVEVAPRDGLQMLPTFVPTDQKVKLIENLRAANLKRIEAVAFVSPKYVPNMADAAEVLEKIGRSETALTMALALNETGLRRAIEAKPAWICYVIAATETMSRKNANTTIADGVAMIKKAVLLTGEKKIKLRGSIAVTWVCPYEGDVPPERVLEITEELVKAGVDEVAFNDTIGKAAPNKVFELCRRAAEKFPETQFAGHFHDTYFTGLANIYAALTAGFKVFDAAAGGLGGCPFAPGASGNVATEKVVWMLEQMGIKTGIDQEKLLAAAALARSFATPNQSV